MTLSDFLRENAPYLATGFLLTFLSSFGQTFFISIFAGHIMEAFALSHGQWGLIYGVGTFSSAVLMVWAGGLTDRFRVRGLAPVFLILLAAACVAMAVNPVWWGLVFVIFALRFGGQGMTSHIAIVAMSRWFIATRGRALAVATLGYAIGEALLPLIFVALMVMVDWRILWVVAAGIALLGILPLRHLLRLERTPASLAEENQAFGMGGIHWTRNETLRHYLFWFMVLALLGPSAFGTAFFFHQVHFADLKNISHVELVAMYPFFTLVSIGAMIASGWALDRFGAGTLIPYYLIPMVVGFVIFAYATGPIGLLAGFLFIGLSIGFNTTLPAAFWAEFYGTGHIGSIKAMATAVMVLGSAIGPGVTGVLIDLGVGLETQYVLVGGYFVVATIMMMIGVRRARPALALAA
ncbi:MAG: MFS transporter [Pseudomonadota bacterium]